MKTARFDWAMRSGVGCQRGVATGLAILSWGSGQNGKEVGLSYVIAAYSLVFATILGYGLWTQSQRRALIREAEKRRAKSDADTESEL